MRRKIIGEVTVVLSRVGRQSSIQDVGNYSQLPSFPVVTSSRLLIMVSVIIESTGYPGNTALAREWNDANRRVSNL